MLIAFALVHLGSYQFMSSMASKSIDLNVQSGMAEHAKDIILLTTIIQALSLASGYFLVLWLLVSFSLSVCCSRGLHQKHATGRKNYFPLRERSYMH